MNREMTVFFSLAVALGVLLFLGLQFEPHLAPLKQPRSLENAPIDVADPKSQGATGVTKERKNPFAPPIEVKQITQPKQPVKPVLDAPPPPPPPPTPSNVVAKPKHITELSPAEIPVDFQGIFALPNQPAEAHLLAKDGSTMIVHVGDELAALGVKIVEISGNDVTVQVGDRRASLRDLFKKQATDTTPGGAAPPAGTTGATGTAPKQDVGDFIKKLMSGAGGKIDMSAIKDLPPEEVQKLLSDPQVQKLIEEQLHPNQEVKPADTQPQRPPHGNRNRGGNGGGEKGAANNNAEGERANKTEVQR
jgi:hypothetical protein